MSNITKNDLVTRFENWASYADSASEIISHLSISPRATQHSKIRQYILFHEGDLTKLLFKKSVEGISNIRLELINERASSFRLSLYSKSRENQISGVLTVIDSDTPNFFRLITVSYSDFWEKIVKKLVRNLYPEAMPVFFKQDETRNALLSLQNFLGSSYQIVISEVTMKRKIIDESRPTTGKVETDRLWTKLFVSEAFEQALEGNYWFTSIQFDIRRMLRSTERFVKIATGRIYKQGFINYDLRHNEIENSIIKTLEAFAAERLNFLSGRGLRERNFIPNVPLQITYGRDFFDEVSEVRRFGEVIAKFPKSTRAVYHANPYYHASVADFLDGSSFEIWILSSRRILIVPQAKCTPQALERLIAHVFSEFGEGELGDYAS